MNAGLRLEAERAAFRYPGRASALGPFDLTARGGELHLVSGASGSGKSTLARLLTGVIPHLYRGALSGRVRIDGLASAAAPLWQLAERVGLVGQNPAAQLLAATVRDEIAFGLRSLALSSAEAAARVDAALDAAGLTALAERDPQTLSGGEQQRLVVAAIAARRPRALVLDEPLSMLDAPAARLLVANLDALRAAGTTVVVCEHRAAAFAALSDVRRHALADAPLDAAQPLPALPTLPPFRLGVEGLGVSFDGRAALRDVSLTLAGGEVVVVVGANGAGKTTLLRALAGLQKASGRTSTMASAGAPAPRLGLCFQNPDCQLFNASVGAELRFGRAATERARYRAVLDLLGLAPYEDTPPLLLSEGEKKRLGIAIMLLQPGLSGLCLDEPTLGQDAAGRRLLGRIVRHLAQSGYLCVVATHDADWAAAWGDRAVVLADGEVVATAPAAALASDGALRARLGLDGGQGDDACRHVRHSH
ncbi:MAG TPA: ABC transporter ATP-binding protein [Candidatus Dormibacteraeota bacterium]|nr:ABC transporter ATP-binding protein [Candidatus Dormibacteraeota bacterium]